MCLFSYLTFLGCCFSFSIRFALLGTGVFGFFVLISLTSCALCTYVEGIAVLQMVGELAGKWGTVVCVIPFGIIWLITGSIWLWTMSNDHKCPEVLYKMVLIFIVAMWSISIMVLCCFGFCLLRSFLKPSIAGDEDEAAKDKV